MATKPTVRIPLWASTGSKVDPGAGKEATGWVPSERPAANWLNWTWNAIGQWLNWAEDSVDEIEALIGDLIALAPVSVFTVTTDNTSGVPTVTNVHGPAPNVSGTQTASGLGDTGAVVRVTWPSAVFATPPVAIQITPQWTSILQTICFPMARVSTTSRIEFVAANDPGGFVDFDSANDQTFTVCVYGVLA